MDKVRVNIFGSCVSRDIFNYINSDSIVVERYLGRNSIFSMNMNPINDNKLKMNINNIYSLKWEERMIIIDANKWGYQYINNDADFLLIDLMDERFGLIYNDEQNINRQGLTYSQVLARSEYIDIFENWKRSSVDLDSDFADKCISLFCNKIKEMYNPRHIFINKAMPSIVYIGLDREYHLFDNKTIKKAIELSRRLGKLYKKLYEKLPESILLDMDYNIIADESHKWKLAYMHYEPYYYEQMAKNIKKIIKEI